ncbi:MAG: GNAT family N-acetyltransferase [Candidatus Eremiobacteraeota bacterium]|nr:GNAT family N-acetyltransferase [Candidatus Eremiobacteraeota bacterium]
MDYTVRKAKEEDIDAVIDLAAEMVVRSLSPFRDIPAEQVKQFRKNDLAVLKNSAGYSNVGIFIAEDEKGQLMGHVIVVSGDIETSTGERQGWVFDLSVKDQFQKKGVGTRLMDEAERFVRAQGLRYLGMGVTTSNKNAVLFYEHLGYAEERKRMIKKLT